MKNENWIRVEDELPVEGRSVLCVNVNLSKPVVYEGYRIGNSYRAWAIGGGHRLQITHWMPLPKPPID